MTSSVTLPTDKASFSEFVPAAGLKNTHLQTIGASTVPRKWLLARRFSRYKPLQQEMILDCSDGVRLQGFYNESNQSRSETNRAKTLAILIHGWEGSHESSYMMSAAARLLDSGVDVFRLNLRDHGSSHHLNREIFNSTMVEEVVYAVTNLQARFSYDSTILGGFSLGGNFALRVAADAKPGTLSLDAVAAFCPVVDPSLTNARLSEKRNWVYSDYFIRKWKRSLIKKARHWPEYSFANDLDRFKSLTQMNQALVSHYTGFSDPEDYFKAYSIAGDRLAGIAVPCFLHFSQDDMMIPAEDANLINNNPALNISVSPHGGHCGFINNWLLESWQDQRLLEITRLPTTSANSAIVKNAIPSYNE